MIYPNSPVWTSFNWHDLQADANRPAPRAAPPGGPPYAVTTDLGWFMDTNRGVGYDTPPGTMGGDFFGNANHVGTYLKEIDVGAMNYLNHAGAGWTAGTQGIAYASGTAQNVIVPFNFAGTWIANTNVVPEPRLALPLLAGIGLAMILTRRRPAL